MIDLRKILPILFADKDYYEMEQFLEDYNLFEPIKKSVSQLNIIITEQDQLVKQCSILPVGHIAANLLVTINQKIVSERNIDKKENLENTLAALCFEILKAFLESVNDNRDKLIRQIEYALRNTCELYNYDFAQIGRFMKFEAVLSYLMTLKNSDQFKSIENAGYKRIPYYIWNGDQTKRKNFIEIFSDQKLLNSKVGISLLFSTTPGKLLNLQFDEAKADLLVQFFSNLKHKKLISYVGCKGFYMVLEYHAIDFKEIFLKNKSARLRINALKQSKTKWSANQLRISKWLEPFIIKQT